LATMGKIKHPQLLVYSKSCIKVSHDIRLFCNKVNDMCWLAGHIGNTHGIFKI